MFQMWRGSNKCNIMVPSFLRSKGSRIGNCKFTVGLEMSGYEGKLSLNKEKIMINSEYVNEQLVFWDIQFGLRQLSRLNSFSSFCYPAAFSVTKTVREYGSSRTKKKDKDKETKRWSGCTCNSGEDSGFFFSSNVVRLEQNSPLD